jgi:Na+/H+-dicarboxylate symporter
MELTSATAGLPLWVILIPFAIFAIVFFIYSAFNFYHLIRFGVYSYSMYLIMTLYILATVGILSTATFFLMGYNFYDVITVESIFGAAATQILPGV